MKKLEQDLRNYLGDKFDKCMRNTESIARVVAKFAHRGQVRENGTEYFKHPESLAKHYRSLAKLDDVLFDEVNLNIYHIPYEGVVELCYLHDVLEDTIYTNEDIKDLFINLGKGDYHKEYIETPLLLITHNKTEPYESYIAKVITNIRSALVKFLDLYDNLYPFSLKHLGDKELDRMQRYCKYLKVINDEYGFIEFFNYYNRMVR